MLGSGRSDAEFGDPRDRRLCAASDTRSDGPARASGEWNARVSGEWDAGVCGDVARHNECGRMAGAARGGSLPAAASILGCRAAPSIVRKKGSPATSAGSGRSRTHPGSSTPPPGASRAPARRRPYRGAPPAEWAAGLQVGPWPLASPMRREWQPKRLLRVRSCRRPRRARPVPRETLFRRDRAAPWNNGWRTG